MRTIIATIVVLVTNSCFGQNAGVSISSQGTVVPWGSACFNQGFASTPAEGFLNGASRYFLGSGQFLESVGTYENLMQDAYTKAIGNRSLRMQTGWELVDQWKERYNARHPNYIARRHHQLDMMEATKELKERERKLLPKPNPALIVDGKKYKGFNEFSKTDHFLEFQAEAWYRDLMNKVDGIEAAERRKAAVDFEKNRRRYSAVTQQFMDQQVRHKQRVKEIRGF